MDIVDLFLFFAALAFWMAKTSLNIFLPIWFSHEFFGLPRTLQNLLNQPTWAGFNAGAVCHPPLSLAIWKWRPKILVLRSNMTSMSYIDLPGFLDCWVRKLDTKIHLRMETNWPQLCWWLDTTTSIVSAPAPPCRKMYAATTPQARTLQKAKFPQRREMWWSYSTKSITIIMYHDVIKVNTTRVSCDKCQCEFYWSFFLDNSPLFSPDNSYIWWNVHPNASVQIFSSTTVLNKPTGIDINHICTRISLSALCIQFQLNSWHFGKRFPKEIEHPTYMTFIFHWILWKLVQRVLRCTEKNLENRFFHFMFVFARGEQKSTNPSSKYMLTRQRFARTPITH